MEYDFENHSSWPSADTSTRAPSGTWRSSQARHATLSISKESMGDVLPGQLAASMAVGSRASSTATHVCSLLIGSRVLLAVIGNGGGSSPPLKITEAFRVLLRVVSLGWWVPSGPSDASCPCVASRGSCASGPVVSALGSVRVGSVSVRGCGWDRG
jgi:hypothetical protein